MTTTTTAKKLPERIIKAIEEEKLSKDHIIYYDLELGWVCQERDDAFIDSLSESARKNSTNEAHPLESLDHSVHLALFTIKTITLIYFIGTKPTKVSLSIIGSTGMYQIAADHGLNRLNMVDEYGQHTPLAPINLTGTARDVAYIPQDATHFCWIYPPIGLTQLTKPNKIKLEQEIVHGNLEYTFFALGGFAYLRGEENSYRMLRANCLVQADNGLTFDGPFPWHHDYTAHLAKQGRFQDATISTLLNLGIKYYCFINPSEELISSKKDSPAWIPAPHGGFVYLYNSNLEPHQYDRYFPVADEPHSDQISMRVMPFSLIDKRNSSPTISPSANSTDTTDRKYLCSICFDRTIRCIFIPCKHMCTCNKCAEKIRKRNHSRCPICRETFREIWDVFL